MRRWHRATRTSPSVGSIPFALALLSLGGVSGCDQQVEQKNVSSGTADISGHTLHQPAAPRPPEALETRFLARMLPLGRLSAVRIGKALYGAYRRPSDAMAGY